MNKIMSKQAVSYIRFSSVIQEKGISIKRQVDLVNEWLTNHPQYTLVKEYRDEARSAFKGAHMLQGAALPSLIADMKAGHFKRGTALLVEALDRLSRESLRDAERQLYELLEIGFEVVITSQNGRSITYDEWDDIGKRVEFMVYQKEAHHQSKEKSRRGKKNWSDKRDDALSGKIMTRMCPAWLRVNSEKTKFERVDPHWDTVRRIFKMRIEGLSMAMIAKKLNDDNTQNFKPELIKDAEGKTISRRDTYGKWNQTTIQQLLINPAVHGVKIPSKQATEAVRESADPISGYYTVDGKSPVTLSDFQVVQKMSTGWGKGKSPANDSANKINIFKGVLVCKHCGATVISNSVTKLKMGYYVCSMRRMGRCSESKSIRRDITEAAIVKGLLYKVETLLIGSVDLKETIREMEAERAEISTKRNLLTDLLLDGRIERDTYNTRYDLLGSQLAQMDYQIQVTRSEMNADAIANRVMHLDLSKSPARTEMQLIAKSIITRIHLDGNSQACDIELASGYTLNNYPLNKIIDGDNWIEYMHITGNKEHTFTGSEKGEPLYIQMQNAPEWVKESIDEESDKTSVRTS